MQLMHMEEWDGGAEAMSISEICVPYNRLFMRESNFCEFASEKHFAKKRFA